MRHPSPSRPAVLFLLLLFALAHAPRAAAAPQREHLTPEEVEQVRNNQSLDKRMGVFVKAVERRVALINDPKTGEHLSAKELEAWGEVKGTRVQLLSDVEHILEEAVTNVEDATIHSEKSSLIPAAVRRLGEAARTLLPQLAALRDKLDTEVEQAVLGHVVESLEEIAAAESKLPAEEKKAAEKKKSKN